MKQQVEAPSAMLATCPAAPFPAQLSATGPVRAAEVSHQFRGGQNRVPSACLLPGSNVAMSHFWSEATDESTLSVSPSLSLF